MLDNRETEKRKSTANYNQGKTVAVVSILGNLFLSLVKFTAGFLGNSSAMIADAVHSASDVVTSIAVYIGMKVAEKPADTNHPWGHGKAEAIAAKVVAIALIFVGFEIGYGAVLNIKDASFSEVKPIALWAAVISIVLKELNYQYAWRLGKKLDSVSLKADAWHHRTDAISSIAAFIGIAFSIYGGEKWMFMDHLAALTVAIMITYVGIKFFREAAADLMDENIPANALKEIRNNLKKTTGVLDVESLTARRSGLGILVDVHLEVDPHISVEQGHEIASAARKDLKKLMPKIQDVLVHIEPFYPNDH